MSIDKILIKFLGVSRGDEKAFGKYKFILLYLICSAARSLLRLIANHCIIPSLRAIFFRLSGIRIGKNSAVNMNVVFMDSFIPDSICLEDDVSIAPFVSLIADSHPNNSVLYKEYGLCKSGKILIKAGAWLGVGCVILPGITVGKAAVIGANAVVTKDVDDYAIMAGAPAKKIGDVRFYKSGHPG